MQHIPATIEEQLLLKAIREESPWENLPKRLQLMLTSKEEWHKRIIDYCIKKRLQWNQCYARKVCKEGEYYEEMMRYLRKNLALFPYHLAEYVCRVMRVSPFRYYCDMIFEVLKNEQPYDSIPNFSAADALRLTGIGRNEYIDIMNKCRSKKIMWKLNKSIAKELLPTQPVDFPVEPWWGVCLVNFTLEEFKKLTEEEMATIDKVCKEEANSYVLFDPDIVRGLYRRGLMYFDVPVYPDDRFKVSRLEGFVSNREQSYEDPIEELLYAVFVVSSENATVAELASTLQADLSQLQAAASFACRLGWAIKLLDPESVLRDSGIPGSPSNILSDDEEGSNVSINSEKSSHHGHGPVTEKTRTISGTAHVAFVVDANITSYLMMGSVSPGLKSHAVTLYEAGKLGDSSIAELCKDLSTLEGKKFEGELQEFANHAYSLRCVLQCLQSGGVASDDKNEKAANLTGSHHSSIDDITTVASEICISEESGEPNMSDAKAFHNDDSFEPDTKSSLTDSSPNESDSANIPPQSCSEISAENNMGRQDYSSQNDHKITSLDGAENDKILPKRKRKYRVDILRCESLAALAPATLERLFLRDYDIIASMVPLPTSSVIPGASGPFHFGPPCYSSMTPWMKLVLYTQMSSGPLSVVLMKGQCLRLLPAPLAGCEKALIWSWDGSVVGGLGGKFEGNLVKGNVLLHCLNSMLKHSAVLVQPLSRYDLDGSGQTVTVDIALPLKNFDGSVQSIESDMGVDPDEIGNLNSLLNELSSKVELLTVGYIRLLRLRKEMQLDTFLPDHEKYEWVPLSLEFGIPLFNPKLCGKICKRIVSSHLLQTDSLSEHHDAMQSLRKKLREICSEYQATGPTAKLFYRIEQVRESPRQLISYASGRWSPTDPSTPISGVSSGKHRLKLANRQRCKTEVLSFDGNILRSYALTPIYETASQPMEDSTSGSGAKHESDEADSREVVLPGVNLLFDGSQLHPFDIGACLQARQPILLIAEASGASASMHTSRTSI
ncbi:protein FAM91A1-like isoform X2 [Canna indica]|uniref:Protein FAM91A1-like isoform X2 n=1 Tax=Canna indica TaxID=4628 RepID=A0AAQ3JTL3_9LILI|nr:protein FAM91A1-like isoform X2 [Canna indica]